MSQRRPRWSRLSQEEMERERARLRAKSRALAQKLRDAEQAAQARRPSERVAALRAHLDCMELADQALKHRVRQRPRPQS